jgi:Fe-S cluster assembly ATP-binding protein
MTNKPEYLEIKNLTVSIENRIILQNLNLTIKENEVHVIMGPNGSGKSTLSKVLAGHPSYKIEQGSILFKGRNLLEIPAENRAHEGIFLAFQHPLEINGVTNYDFLHLAYNEKQKYLGKPEIGPLIFMELVQKVLEKLKMKEEFLTRNLNEGFSGGEKKKNEILQMLLLNPELIILDEIDSGLDVDAIKTIFETIANNKKENLSILVITHYPRIAEYLKATHFHIMLDGKIVRTGDNRIPNYIELYGYVDFQNYQKMLENYGRTYETFTHDFWTDNCRDFQQSYWKFHRQEEFEIDSYRYHQFLLLGTNWCTIPDFKETPKD